MNIPLSLYIHTPWCIKKCPYCDFNSHTSPKQLPEDEYLSHLKKDWQQQQHYLQQRQIQSIFIGGGTPSLVSAQIYNNLFNNIASTCDIKPKCEITLEANPGACEQKRFDEYRQAGINRISIGVQSFNDNHLKKIGRIHSASNALDAIAFAHQSFDNINIDLMFGLPGQTTEQALNDLNIAIKQAPKHISWYQLTIEPNTAFYAHPPVLPSHEALWEIQLQGQQLLAANGYQQYEVSAYAKENSTCQHNLNYWQFGDYLGIGAGAHGKITIHKEKKIIRQHNVKHPKDYMNKDKPYASSINNITNPLFDYMLNALRLSQPIKINDIEQKTFLTQQQILNASQVAIDEKLLVYDNGWLLKTSKGDNFLNDLMQHFL